MSNDLKQLQRLVFGGLLIQETLADLEKEGISATSSASEAPVELVNVEDFSPRVAHAARTMAPVYALFHMFENSVRELITERLVEKHGANWWDGRVGPKIRTAVASLVDKESRAKHRSPRSTTTIGYTTFGQLADIIISNWDDFSDLFPDQHFVKSRLDDAEGNRNVLMHSGLLPPEEIDRLEMIVKDWLRHTG